MEYLATDEKLFAHLSGVKEPLEIRDPSGRVMGHYIPLSSDEEDAVYARAAELFDLEEIERTAAAEHNGYSIDEVMEHLRSLEKTK